MSRSAGGRGRFAAIKSTQETAAATSEAAPAAETVRTKPMRVSVDWLPQDFRRVRSACVDLAEGLGLANVPASDLHRAALRQVLDDPAALERLRTDIAAGRGKL